MPECSPKGFWPRCWRVVRWCRITFLLLVLLLVSGVIYLMEVDLPSSVKSALVSELRNRGLDLEISRMRVRWNGAIVAESVSLAQRADPNGPKFRVDEVDLKLDPQALREFKFHVEALEVRRGRALWPLIVSNQPPREFAFSNLMVRLQLRPGDRWELDQFDADCLGIKFKLSASITNASAWRKPRTVGSTNALRSGWEEQFSKALQIVDRGRFSAPPELNLLVQGDARNPASFGARMNFHFTDGQIMGWRLTNSLLTARWVPGGENSEGHHILFSVDNITGKQGSFSKAKAEIFLPATGTSGTNLVPGSAAWSLEAASARFGKATANNLKLSGQTAREESEASRLKTDGTLRMGLLNYEADSLTNILLSLHFGHSLAKIVPTRIDWQCGLTNPVTRWGSAGAVNLEGTLNRHPAESGSTATPAWGWWSKLEPFCLDFKVDAMNIDTPKLQVEQASLALRWQSPELRFPEIRARLYGGDVFASGKLDVPSRVAELSVESNMDAHRISPLLTTNSQHWLEQFSWKEPPQVAGKLRVTLPAWLERKPDWREEVQPTLEIAGHFDAGEGAFRGVTVSSASSDFFLTNMIWYLPNLTAIRPEGLARLQYQGSMEAHDFHWNIDSGIDLRAIEPLLDESQRKGFNSVQFSSPPRLSGDIWGRWHEPETVGFVMTAAASNFVARGEQVASFTSGVAFTNLYLLLTNVHLTRVPGEDVYAEAVGFDIPAKTLFFTNGTSTADPHRFTAAIGPKTAKAIEPYHFGKPPHVKVRGSLEIAEKPIADLHFEIAGEEFQYWKFHLSQLNGVVHWKRDSLSITNVQGDFYQGRMNADFAFDFSPHEGAEFNFRAQTTNTSMKLLMADIVSPTNRFSGSLDGTLNITSANSVDWGSWNGNGTATLRDGYLWDIPIFGIFTPLMNAVSPGLGNSPVHSGTATFGIKKSVISTEDFDIHSSAMRLLYRGTVDFEGKVNARVEALLLRDVWMVGRVFSFVFMPLTKLFEYQVSGTLNNPKSEPLYTLPKMLLSPLHPFRTLKGLLPGDTKTPSAKTPPTSDEEKPAKP